MATFKARADRIYWDTLVDVTRSGWLCRSLNTDRTAAVVFRGGLGLFTEYTERNEAKLYEKLSKLIKGRMEQIYGNSPRALRDTHAKSHAAVRAQVEIFDIDEDTIRRSLAERTELSPSLIQGIAIKQGLFARPQRYPAWLRFANGQGSVQHDRKSDTRSMSVKIIGVEGKRLPESYQSNVQDIITQNGNVFLISTIANYFRFLRAAFRSKLLMLLWLIFHPRQFRALRRMTKLAPKSLLTERYWSGSAFALGLSKTAGKFCPEIASVTYPAVVKFVFTPCMPEEPFNNLPQQKIDLPNGLIPENYYREELIEKLARPDAKYCWNIGIQFQTNEDMSIDDITVPWCEEQSPFFTVGRMTVEHQVIHFEKQFDFCENLTYSPWNGLEVHRPVGALNRLRRLVYPLVKSFRLKKRGVEVKEMTGDESPDSSSA